MLSNQINENEYQVLAYFGMDHYLVFEISLKSFQNFLQYLYMKVFECCLIVEEGLLGIIELQP